MQVHRFPVTDEGNGRPVVEAAELAAAEREAVRRQGREVVLVVMLTLFLAAAGVAVLVFVTMGFFLWVALVGLGFFVLGSVHYLLWGRWIERAVEGAEDEGPPEQSGAEARWQGRQHGA